MEENISDTEYPSQKQVNAQAIAFLYQNLPGIVINLTIMPTVMVIVMWSLVDHILLIAWLVMAYIVIAVRYQLVLSYEKKKPNDDEAPRWAGYFTLTSLFSGLIWGAAGILFFIPESASSQVFLFTCIIGLSAGSIIVTGYWLNSFYAFSVPSILITVSHLLVYGDSTYQGLGLLLLMYLAIVVKVAKNTKKSATTAIRLRFENVDLVEKLREQNLAAEQANVAKSKFLAAASHDLRQPLHALSLFMGALREQEHSSRSHSLLGSMERSVESLEGLFNALLDISKLDAGVVDPNIQNFALAPIIKRLQEEYQPQAEEKGLSWENNSIDFYIKTDAVLLETILRNLLSNAIRYTESGNVKMHCQILTVNNRSIVCIEVIDTGIGIPLNHQKEIFHEFHQLNNSERDKEKGLGLGLGLAIVHRLSGLLNFNIQLHSKFGEGSTFSINLPLGNSSDIDDKPSMKTSQLGMGFDGMCALVIDDEIDIIKGMRELFKSWGCDAVIASSEDEAIIALNQEKKIPDVIISDYHLREKRNGIQAIQRIQQEFGKDISALIITGDTASESLKRIEKSGYLFLHKPVQPAKLRAFLQTTFRKLKV